MQFMNIWKLENLEDNTRKLFTQLKKIAQSKIALHWNTLCKYVDNLWSQRNWIRSSLWSKQQFSHVIQDSVLKNFAKDAGKYLCLMKLC